MCSSKAKNLHYLAIGFPPNRNRAGLQVKASGAARCEHDIPIPDLLGTPNSDPVNVASHSRVR
jgi:hypothetical protein